MDQSSTYEVEGKGCFWICCGIAVIILAYGLAYGLGSYLAK